ncbi:MAG: hypothetical protein AAGC96_02815 [Pseudomonadota bacterium]
MSAFSRYKPLTLLALGMLAVATLMGWLWVWGLLYLYWAVTGAMSGRAFVIEDITRSESPVLFWVINVLWAAAGLWAISTAL